MPLPRSCHIRQMRVETTWPGWPNLTFVCAKLVALLLHSQTAIAPNDSALNRSQFPGSPASKKFRFSVTTANVYYNTSNRLYRPAQRPMSMPTTMQLATASSHAFSALQSKPIDSGLVDEMNFLGYDLLTSRISICSKASVCSLVTHMDSTKLCLCYCKTCGTNSTRYPSYTN